MNRKHVASHHFISPAHLLKKGTNSPAVPSHSKVAENTSSNFSLMIIKVQPFLNQLEEFQVMVDCVENAEQYHPHGREGDEDRIPGLDGRARVIAILSSDLCCTNMERDSETQNNQGVDEHISLSFRSS